MDNVTAATRAAEHAARTSRVRLVSLLAAGNGDLALAEDAISTAFERALRTWPSAGVPKNPDAWLLTVARNTQRDVWKSAAYRRSLPLDVATNTDAAAVNPMSDLDPEVIPDRRLGLLFTCAHPAIDPTIRSPLMLQVVLGFTAAEIAGVLGVPATALAKRITRAKWKIRDAKIPFEVPQQQTMRDRLPPVLEAIYGCFTLSRDTDDANAIASVSSMLNEVHYLAVTLASLLDREPEAWGLAALVAYSMSRLPTQMDTYVPVEEQDPANWDSALLDEADAMLRRASPYDAIGRFQIEAAMQAVHADRRHSGKVDWSALATLSEALLVVAPSLGARIAHAAILVRTADPTTAADFIAAVRTEFPQVERIQTYHAALAEILVRSKHQAGAHKAYQQAIELADRPSVRNWLLQRAAQHHDDKSQAWT